MKYFILAIAFAVAVAAAAPEKFYISTPTLRLAQDIAADGHGNVRLRLVFEPASADVSAQKWESSEPEVVAVADDGTIELLKEGEADVTVSFGGVRSKPCRVSVLPAENRSVENRNLRFVPRVKKGENRIDKYAFLAMPEEYGDAVVALWADDKTAAYSMTSDDGPAGDIARWLEITGKWGGTITMGLCVGYGSGSTRDFYDMPSIVDAFKNRRDRKGNSWKEFIEAGHDIQSHSLSHSGVRNTWTSADFHFDLYESRDQVGQLLAELGLGHLQRSQTFLAANGGWPSEYIGRFYTAGRNGGSIYADGNNSTDKASPDDYQQVALTSVCGFAHSDGLIRPLIDPAIEDGSAPDAAKYTKRFGGLRNVLVHMIDLGRNANGLNFSDDIEWIYDNYLHDNRHHLWYDNFTDMTCYAQERDTAEIVNKTVAPDRIAFDMTSVLDETLFDYPLTIKVKLDAAWDRLTVTQDGKPVRYFNGKPAESRLVRRGGGTYAFVKAIPDRGTVVLTKEGAQKTYSGDADLAKLEFRPNVWRMHGNPRLEVPGFDPGTTEYAVTLPPGTPTVAIYGLVADDAARSKREPLMGIVEVSAAGGPRSTSITVTAEDESVKTYTVTFTVAPFEPVESLVITATDCRGGEPNLKQITTSEILAFSVKGERETLDAEGAVVARHFDPATIEWHVNGVVQEGKNGLKFEYLPPKYGAYEIHTKAGAVESEKIAFTFTKGEPKPALVILDEDFSRHETGRPVPLSDDPADNLFSATTPNISAATHTGERGMRVVEIDGRKAAAWVTPDPANAISALQKTFANSATEPLVIACKILVHGRDYQFISPYGHHLLGGQWIPERSHAIFTLAHNFSWCTHIPGVAWKPGWSPEARKWFSLAHVLDPSRRDPANAGLIYEGAFVGNEMYLGKAYDGRGAGEFMAHPARGGRVAGAFHDNNDIGLVFAFGGGPKNPADIGTAVTYFTDVRVYRPGSLIMTPAKDAFAPGEAVRMNFSHHVNISTITPGRVRVSDGNGAVVEIESITTDPLNFDHFVMNFAPGALKSGGTYTVALDENVRDVMDKTAYDTASFTVR